MAGRAVSRIDRAVQTKLVGLLAVVCMGLGIGAPLFQGVFLSAASDLGTAVMWTLTVPAAVVLGVAGLGLAMWRSDSRFARGARIAWVVPCGAFICFLIYMVLNMAWTSFIGPTATIVLPERYSGRFQLTIAHEVRPSLATRGQNFTYVIPGDGVLQVDRGWIGLRFRFKDGINIAGGPYYVQILRGSRRPLTADEFDCKWQGNRVVGIECEVRERSAAGR